MKACANIRKNYDNKIVTTIKCSFYDKKWLKHALSVKYLNTLALSHIFLLVRIVLQKYKCNKKAPIRHSIYRGQI